jgi:hypothetical protein
MYARDMKYSILLCRVALREDGVTWRPILGDTVMLGAYPGGILKVFRCGIFMHVTGIATIETGVVRGLYDIGFALDRGGAVVSRDIGQWHGGFSCVERDNHTIAGIFIDVFNLVGFKSSQEISPGFHLRCELRWQQGQQAVEAVSFGRVIEKVFDIEYWYGM